MLIGIYSKMLHVNSPKVLLGMSIKSVSMDQIMQKFSQNLKGLNCAIWRPNQERTQVFTRKRESAS